MLADSQRIIASLRDELDECRGERDKAQRKLDERTTERDEALAQQTATAEVLQVINSSPGDLAPVFDATLEKAMRLCGADFGIFAIYDEEHYRIVATHGVPLGLAEFVRQAVRIHPGSMPDRLRRGADTIQVPDITALGSELRTPGLIAMIELGNARTAVWVALRKDGVAQGFIGVYRQEVRPFSDKQIALLRNFAAQAVIAMENARLLAELRQRTQELTRREAALRDSEERYALAMRAINEGVYEWDVASSEMYYSPRVCELVGLQASELRTMTDWTDRIHPDDREPFKRTILAHFKGETDSLEAEYRYRHADGSWHWARQHGFALKNEAGRAYRVVGSTGDITDRKAAEQALEEALEQQTATAEVLQVINASPGDLAPVFDAMLAKGMRLCGAAFGFMTVIDGERSRTVAARGVPAAYAAFRERNPTPANAPIASRVRKGEPFIHTVDLKAERFYGEGDPQRRANVDLGGARTLLAVPLLRDQAVLGAIQVYRTEVRPFTEKQIALLQSFAAQAVIAMENARLLGELQVRTRDLEESLGIPDRDQQRAQGHQPLDLRCTTGAGHGNRNGRTALRRRLRKHRNTRGRALPLCVEFDQYSEPRVMGDLAPANNCPRSRQRRRAGGARRRGRACRGPRRRPGLRAARGCGGRATYRTWSAAPPRPRADRRHLAFPAAGRAVHRAADRAGADLCRPGGHRDGKRAAALRIAGPY
jgi:PAS domain S-box-containing protein